MASYLSSVADSVRVSREHALLSNYEQALAHFGAARSAIQSYITTERPSVRYLNIHTLLPLVIQHPSPFFKSSPLISSFPNVYFDHSHHSFLFYRQHFGIGDHQQSNLIKRSLS